MKMRQRISLIIKRHPYKICFMIGALLGAVLFMCIYGLDVLNVTYDKWLLTGKDLQQHYIGWKYYRNSAWTFPIGLHDGLTHPYYVSVLYTDSIPLFAIIFKALSPILPDTFQYFGLFGLMCYVLNGGLAALLIARINKSKIFCALGSVFFILSTPVLQRLFGLTVENSRHTSLAAHFLILAALGIWMYRDKFHKYWKAALAYSLLGVLCVLIQMYIIFIVGGIMCGYLLHCILKEKDWKRFFIVFGSFGASSLLAFYLVGGFTDVLIATADGFGRYSANMNALFNPYHYSTFFDALPWCTDQYEGLSYLGLGVFVLYFICACVLLVKAVRIRSTEEIKRRLKVKYRKHRCGIIPLIIVIVVFWGLALTNIVFWGTRMVMQIYLPQRIFSLFAIVRSSGRFMWVIMYLMMLFGLYMVTRQIKNVKVQKIIVMLCICLQIADLAAPIARIHAQYTSEPVLDDIYAKDSFWDQNLGRFKHIVYYTLNSCGLYQMMQIGTKASCYGVDSNYFYMSRFYTKAITKKENNKNKKLFENNQLAEDTIYITDYINAHKYKDRCYLYQADNRIIAVKNPIEGATPYHDVYVSKDNPVLELEFSYNGLGRVFAHNGWNIPDYGDDGMWTTDQSVIRIYSGGAKKVHVRLEYEGGKRKGTTKIKVNGVQRGQFDNKTSGVVEFDTRVKETISEKRYKGINWLFLNTNKTFKAKGVYGDEQRGVYIKKMTVTYIE